MSFIKVDRKTPRPFVICFLLFVTEGRFRDLSEAGTETREYKRVVS